MHPYAYTACIRTQSTVTRCHTKCADIYIYYLTLYSMCTFDVLTKNKLKSRNVTVCCCFFFFHSSQYVWSFLSWQMLFVRPNSNVDFKIFLKRTNALQIRLVAVNPTKQHNLTSDWVHHYKLQILQIKLWPNFTISSVKQTGFYECQHAEQQQIKKQPKWFETNGFFQTLTVLFFSVDETRSTIVQCQNYSHHR